MSAAEQFLSENEHFCRRSCARCRVALRSIVARSLLRMLPEAGE
jgi:hypothetical protein